MEKMEKEVEKMKDQIKTLNTSLLILSIIFAVTASCYAFGYHQLHSAVQEAVQCVPLGRAAFHWSASDRVWRSGWTWRPAETEPDRNPRGDRVWHRNHGSESVC